MFQRSLRSWPRPPGGWLGGALAALSALSAAVPAARGEPGPGLPAPREILDRVDDLFRSESSHGRLSMEVQTRHWSRTVALEFWSHGKEQTLLRILAPRKEKGTATLKNGRDLWNYLPKIRRVIKIPSSMMSASWMGSHFTNDDLVKEARMADDYTHELLGRRVRDGQELWEVCCTPKPNSPVVWGKVLVTVRAADYLPVEIQYFDEEQRLARTLTFSDLRELGGRLLPVKLTMQPADKPEERTVIIHEEYAFDVPLDEGLFTLRNLQD